MDYFNDAPPVKYERRRGSSLAEALAPRAKELYDSGRTFHEVAILLGVALATATRALHHAGVKGKRGGLPTMAERLAAQAKALHETGLKVHEVAARLGVANSTANRALRLAGVQAGRRGPEPQQRPPEMVARAAKLYLSGYTVRLVADEMGITDDLVCRLLAAAGVPRRRRS